MVTRALANFAATATESDLPAETVDQLKLMLLDQVGICHFVAAETEWGNIATAFAVDQGGSGAGVYRHEQLTSAPYASLANATLAMGFEYEDMHTRSNGHTFSIVGPAALAASQLTGASGVQLIAALAVGYEVGCRVSYALRKDQIPWTERGLYPASMFGVFGAAAAAGRALALEAEEMANALGIAGSQAFGTMQAHKEGTMARRLNAGRAAEIGVTAAILARRGFTGPTEILEGELGFFATYADDYDLPAIVDSLGTEWATDGAWLKFYPCNGLFQAALDGLLRLLHEHSAASSDVVKVRARIAKASRLHSQPDTSSATRAQFSLHYCLAVGLAYGRPQPRHFLDASLQDPRVLRLLDAVSVELDPELRSRFPDSARPAVVEVEFASGDTVSAEVPYPKGHPRNPMTWEDVERKFTELVDGLMPGERAREIRDAVRALENLETIPVLT